MRLRTFFYLVLVALFAVGCDPIIMIPGGSLSGELTPIPTSWTFTNEVDTVQLKTRPTDPYSVNIWAVEVEGSLFVVAGSGLETTWAQHIQNDPLVRLRVGDALYELRASEADTEANREGFLVAAKKKYDFEPEGEDVDKAILYRLDPR
jgi:hypothetical protein